MKIMSYLAAILIVGLIMVTIFGTLGDLGRSDKYDININGTLNDTYDKIDDIDAVMRDMEQDIQNISVKEDSGFFTGAWDAFTIARKTIFGTVGATAKTMSLGNDLLQSAVGDVYAGQSNQVDTSGQGSTVGTVLRILLYIGIIGAILAVILKWEV